jgi:glycosyltransferase involved in cell wall biosynthesis
MTDLAIVLISKNQEWNIARLIESVLNETNGKLSRDIVLVDSASTDNTVEIACSYPIRILRLRSDQTLTPAAGRYIGLQQSSGDLVLFLDGDMELYKGWLEKAMALLKSQPEAGVVTGRIIDLPQTSRTPDGIPPESPATENSFCEVLYCGGAALYKRSVLNQVGNFNPYLRSDEEPELCLRIRHGGYRILQLGYPLAYHFTDPVENLSTLVRRWKRKFFLGSGQILRYYLGSKLLWPYIKIRGYGLPPALGIMIGLVCFLWALTTRQWVAFYLWALLVVIIVIGDIVRKRSLYRTVYSLFRRIFILDGMIKGFLMKSFDAESYPGRFDVIK